MTHNGRTKLPAGGFETEGTDAPSLTLKQTFRPILLAPLGAVAAQMVFSAFLQRPVLMAFWPVAAMIYLFALGGAVCFVLPAFVLVPSLRRPPVWIAVPWGVLIAWIVGFATGPINFALQNLLRWEISIGFGAAGAAAAMVYVIAARRAGRAAR